MSGDHPELFCFQKWKILAMKRITVQLHASIHHKYLDGPGGEIYERAHCSEITITIELTHSKTTQKNTVEIKPQPVALDFKNLSQYSSCSK